MGRFGNSWLVFRQSMGVLNKDKELLLLPFVSFIASAIVVASFVVPTYFSGLFESYINQTDPNAQAYLAGIFFVMYLMLSFVTIYFQAGVMHAANLRLEGWDPTLGNALKGPSKILGKIFLWSIFAATVALLIRGIEAFIRDRAGGMAATIFGWIAGAAWWMATFFAIPVVLFEEKHVGPALKRSSQLFKQRWGETLIGHFGIGMFVTFLAFLGVIPLVAGVVTPAPFNFVFFGIAVLWWLILAALSPTLSAIYKTALYRYAAKGEVVPYFEARAIEGAWTPKAGSQPTYQGFQRV